MATTFKSMPGDCWFCSECKHGPMTVEVNPACCICSNKLESTQGILHDEELRTRNVGRRARTVRRRAQDNKAKYNDEMLAGYFRTQIIYDNMDDLKSDSDSEPESEEDIKMEPKESFTHQLDTILETSPQGQGMWNNDTLNAVPALAVNRPTLVPNSDERGVLDDNAISEDRNNNDYSDDDTSNSDCSTCTWSSNSTGASSTMEMEISSRTWALAQEVVDVLAGTTDWRTPVATRPANSNGDSSSKRNNSAVTEGSSDQTSRAGKRKRTAGDTRKAQPPNNQDKDDEEEEEEEEDITAYIKKDANDQPGLPCIFDIQSLRRPDLPPICQSSSLRGIHRLKEHIGRKHLVHQCLRCGKCFNKERLLLDHSQQATGCVPGQVFSAFGVNQSTLISIKSRKAMRGRTDKEKWKHIYRLAFPDESYVPSPYDSDHPPSDFWVEGGRENSPPEKQFWQNLQNNLYAKLKKAFQPLSEDDAKALHLKDILRDSIRQARTETLSPRSSISDSKEDFPIPLEKIDTLQEVWSLSNFVGVDSQYAQASASDHTCDSTANPFHLECVERQAARFARRVLNYPPSTTMGVVTNVTPDNPVAVPTFMPMPLQTHASNDIQEHPSSSSKEGIHGREHVPPATDPTFLTLFDGATYSTTESSYHLPNEPSNALPIGQGNLSLSHPYGIDNAKRDWWYNFPS